MMVFWLVAVLLIAAALLFVLPPLFRSGEDGQRARRAALNASIYRDQITELERDLDNDVLSQEQFEQGRTEIEHRLLDDVGDSNADSTVNPVAPAAAAASKITAISLVVIVPVMAVLLYNILGTPEGLAPDEFRPAPMSQQAQEDQINQMVMSLAARLENEPNNAEGWRMLGRSYLVLERFADARKAFEQAVRLIPNDPQLLADLADTIAMTSGQSLRGRPMELIKQALAADPQHEKALWLAGTAAYEEQDYRAALGYWQRLYAIQPPGSQGAQQMQRNIAEVQTLLGEPVTPMAPPMTAAGPMSGPTAGPMSGPMAGGQGQSVSAGKISGTLALAPQLQGKVSAGDSVFVFAQAVSGPRMPLAVLRTTAAELPLSFTLDDSLSMMPQMRLSGFTEVTVTARISKSGSATPQSGDLQGNAGTVSTDNTQGLKIVIDQVLP